MVTNTENLLSVENLNVEFWQMRQTNQVLKDITFSVKNGEIFGLIGDSGAGKTVLAHSIMGLIDDYPGIIQGKIMLRDKNILSGIPSSFEEGNNFLLKMKLSRWKRVHKKNINSLLGKDLGMVFQEPYKSLDPFFTVRQHIYESLNAVSDKKQRSIQLLKSVQLDNPEKILNQYVFQLSGGEIQRVMIAIALASSPSLIVVDEPTTALDTITQKKILDLLKQKSLENSQSFLFITHDLGIAANYFNRMAVLFAGRIIEIGNSKEIIEGKIKHYYSSELLDATIRRKRKSIVTEDCRIQSSFTGCAYSYRCKEAKSICLSSEPKLLNVGSDHSIACWNMT